jgi:hypothetical protein
MSRRKGKSAPRAAGRAATPEPRFVSAFLEIARIARLADEQLHRAIGELHCVGRKYTEMPDYAKAELAIFAVSQVAQMAKDFEGLYDRLYDEAAEAHTAKRSLKRPPVHAGGLFIEPFPRSANTSLLGI